ncbi:MAG: tRNA lysidine(34) synthetase TilS [Niabella sp.]
MIVLRIEYFMSMDLVAAFEENIKHKNLFTKKNRLLVAVSGGVDSVVLCHLCKRSGLAFGIAHCNFQLRGTDSIRDEAFVKDMSTQLEVPFYSVRFNTRAFAEENKYAIQEAARVLRYEWFEKIRQENNYDFILTAHHADDNIETVLMNFFRGTGIKGLTGIREQNGKIKRPLLFAKRSDLEIFLNENNIAFVQDESNFKDDYTRNYFRNTVLPFIEKVYPGAADNIFNNIDRLKEVEWLYRNETERWIKRLTEKRGDEVYIPVLLLQKNPAMKTVLLELLKPFGFKASQLPEIIDLLQSGPGKYILSATHRVLKDRRHLIISALKDQNHSAVVIDAMGTYHFPNGVLILKSTTRENISKENNIACIDAAQIQYPLVLRPWRIGDYFYPLGMPKKKKLSRFFIDRKLSLPEKEKTWVLEANKKIIWVVGYRIDDRFKITNSTGLVLRIEWKPEFSIKHKA